MANSNISVEVAYDVVILITENQIRFNETISLDVSIKIFVQQHHNVY